MPHPANLTPTHLPANAQVSAAVQQLSPMTLKELQAADSALMDRIDTKFILTTAQLAAILTTVADTYSVLTIEGVRLQHYYTCYLDTPDLLFYQQHHNGYRKRYKVRMRTYLDSDLAFLEVKVKNNKGRTCKSRLRTEPMSQKLTPELNAFLRSYIPIAPERLTPQLTNTFTRLTLVNRGTPERVTVDFDLRFPEGDEATHHPHLVIAEVKQPRFTRHSPFVQALRAHRSQEMGFSKYCIGIALGRPEIKHNRFKPALLRMQYFH